MFTRNICFCSCQFCGSKLVPFLQVYIRVSEKLLNVVVYLVKFHLVCKNFTSGCAARLVTMSISHITGGGGLGSESAGTMRYTGSFVDFSRLPITEAPPMAQHCGLSAAVAVVSRDPTVRLSLVCPRQGLVMGACAWEGGKCPVPAPTTADRTEPAPCPPLPPLLLRPPPCQ